MHILSHQIQFTDLSCPQTPTHVCLITDFCAGGELFALLDRQPMKIFKEEAARYKQNSVYISFYFGSLTKTITIPSIKNFSSWHACHC